MNIRVLLVDDHPVVRAGLRQHALRAEADLDVVGEAGDGREAVDLAARAASRRGADGPADAGRGRADCDGAMRAGRTSAVLVLTTYDTDADILRAVEAGANGYLLKDTPREG